MPRTYETVYDTENVFDWESITSTFIDGILTIEEKRLDTGFRELTFYRDGYVSSILTLDSDEDVYYWKSKSTAFNTDGDIITEYVNYDNGSIVQMNITDGNVTSKIIKFPDTGAANALQQLSTIYDNGEVVRVSGSYANGTSYQDEFTDGVRDTRYWLDDPFGETDGAKPWASITIKYDITTNEMTDRTTFFDNGIKRVEAFEDGVRSSRVDEDLNDVRSWDTISITYDDTGAIASRETVYDDGDVLISRYENGIRTLTTQQDDPDGTGLNTRNWDTITSTHDESGALALRETLYDDGDTRVETFENGIRTQTIQHDDPDGTGENTRNWDIINSIYDENGDISQKLITYDDGSTNSVFYYEGGGVQFAVREDVIDGTDGVFEWEYIFSTYDEGGNRTSRQTLYDNADELIFIYEQGELQTRLDVDGDDSEDWRVQITDYGVDGNVVTTYDSVTDVPEEYFDLFGIVSF